MKRAQLFWPILMVAGAALWMSTLVACTSAPAADDRPQVLIVRQIFLVPYVAPVEECCWYEPPGDEEYGPI